MGKGKLRTTVISSTPLSCFGSLLGLCVFTFFSNSARIVIACPKLKAMKAPGQSQRYLGWKDYAGCVQQEQATMRNTYGVSVRNCKKVVTLLEIPVSMLTLLMNECLDNVYAPAADPSHDGQACDQPDVATKDVT